LPNSPDRSLWFDLGANLGSIISIRERRNPKPRSACSLGLVTFLLLGRQTPRNSIPSRQRKTPSPTVLQNQAASQAASRPTNKPTNQPTHATNPPTPPNQPNNPPTNQPNWPTIHPNQPTKQTPSNQAAPNQLSKPKPIHATNHTNQPNNQPGGDDDDDGGGGGDDGIDAHDDNDDVGSDECP